jgi:hypothetical protein
MFQFAGFASSRPMYSVVGYSLRSGFPHSDISGSKLHCQLPRAFRRLARPSSPVIAKASTTCTYSLDPITLSSLARSLSYRQLICAIPLLVKQAVDAITTVSLASRLVGTSDTTFFHFVKERQTRNPEEEDCLSNPASRLLLTPVHRSADGGG